MISIIIPTFNEIKNNYLEQILHALTSIKQKEIIIVDSGSTDGTLELLSKFQVNIINVTTTSRAQRLSKGIEVAKGDLIVLHHPRSFISSESWIEFEKNYKNVTFWGAFTHQFDISHPLLNFTSFYSNFIRGDMKSIFYLDHCLFAPSDMLKKLLPLANVDIFEDTLICMRLKKKFSRGKRIQVISTTSAKRFIENGIFKQAWINQKMKILFYLGSDHKKMNKEYENGLELNSHYENK